MILNARLFRILSAAAIALFAVVTMSTAQPVFTSGPCQNIRVNNNSLLPIQITFVTIPPGLWPAGIAIPPGGFVLLPLVPVTTVVGVLSCAGGGVPVRFNAPAPPPGSPCNPGDWWIQSVALPPTCQCFDICADPANCVINIFGGTPPPCLNP